MHSSKIVGHDLSDGWEIKGCEWVINKAINQSKDINGLVYHCNRDIQYCNNVYMQIL